MKGGTAATGSSLVVLGIAAVLAAGCASGSGADNVSSGHPSSPRATTGGRVASFGANPPRPPTPLQVAQQLATGAAVPATAMPSGSAPATSLQSPPSSPSGSGRIIESRWWRIDEPWTTAYSWVAHHQNPDLKQEASGSSGGPQPSDLERYDDFASHDIPLSVNSAMLSIAVVPLSATTSAIAAYAIVVKQPLRQPSEMVPLSDDAVTVSAQSNQAGTVPPTRYRTITGSAAQTFVRDFDQLSIDPIGAHTCPLARESESATFRSGGQTWIATVGLCIGVSVTLDGHGLPLLNTSTPFNRDLRHALGVRPGTNLANIPPTR
jgi:hypothetical protein